MFKHHGSYNPTSRDITECLQALWSWVFSQYQSCCSGKEVKKAMFATILNFNEIWQWTCTPSIDYLQGDEGRYIEVPSMPIAAVLSKWVTDCVGVVAVTCCVCAPRDVEDEHDHKVKKLQRDISDAEFERATITRQKETLESELTAVRQEAAGLRSTVASLSAAQEGIRAELASVKVTQLAVFSCQTVTWVLLACIQFFNETIYSLWCKAWS